MSATKHSKAVLLFIVNACHMQINFVSISMSNLKINLIFFLSLFLSAHMLSSMDILWVCTYVCVLVYLKHFLLLLFFFTCIKSAFSRSTFKKLNEGRRTKWRRKKFYLQNIQLKYDNDIIYHLRLGSVQ